MSRELTKVEKNIIREIYSEVGAADMVKFIVDELLKESVSREEETKEVPAKPVASTQPSVDGLTDRESEMIVRIAESEYNDGDPTESTWANCVCKNRADSALVGSLSKKGYVDCQGSGREATIRLTSEGLMAYQVLRPDSGYAKRFDAK